LQVFAFLPSVQQQHDSQLEQSQFAHPHWETAGLRLDEDGAPTVEQPPVSTAVLVIMAIMYLFILFF